MLAIGGAAPDLLAKSASLDGEPFDLDGEQGDPLILTRVANTYGCRAEVPILCCRRAS